MQVGLTALSLCKTRTTASHVTPCGGFMEGAGEETLVTHNREQLCREKTYFYMSG